MVSYTLIPAEIKQTLSLIGVDPNKSRGQNFLINTSVITSIVSRFANKSVVEIGPGLGSLTLPLLEVATSVTAVEIDLAFCSVLSTRTTQYGLSGLQIVNGDILTIKADTVFAETPRYSICGALPYSITSPIFHRLITEWFEHWDHGVFMIQKEVAEKITTAPPKASYWSMLFAPYYKVDVLVKTIKPSSFWPSPKVESQILEVKRLDSPSEIDPTAWSKFLHVVFAHPRKVISQSFSEAILNTVGIDPMGRPAQLNLTQLTELFDHRS